MLRGRVFGRKYAALGAGALMAVACLLPAAAHGDAITYADGGNVWVASPDGSVKKQLTTNGEPEGVRYFGPSQADDGRIAVIFGAGLGKASSPSIQILSPSGKLEKSGLLQIQTCGAFGGLPTALGNNRINPAGDTIVYDYICTNTGQGGGGTAGTTVYTAFTSGTSPGGVILDELRAARGASPSWLPTKNGETNDVLATDQYGRWLATLAVRLPWEWTPVLEVAEGNTLGGASFSRTGNILTYSLSTEGSGGSRIIASKLSGPPTPDVQILGECIVANVDGSALPSVSPDGNRVAWSDDGGAKVATFNVASGADDQPCGGTTKTISASGLRPVFSGAAAPRNGGGTDPGPGPTPGPVTGLTVKGPSKATRAQAAKGLSFSVKCSTKCTVSATMSAAGKTVARGTRKLKRKGTAKLKLRARLAAGTTSVTVVIKSGSKSTTKTVAISG